MSVYEYSASVGDYSASVDEYSVSVCQYFASVDEYFGTVCEYSVSVYECYLTVGDSYGFEGDCFGVYGDGWLRFFVVSGALASANGFLADARARDGWQCLYFPTEENTQAHGVRARSFVFTRTVEREYNPAGSGLCNLTRCAILDMFVMRIILSKVLGGFYHPFSSIYF